MMRTAAAFLFALAATTHSVHAQSESDWLPSVLTGASWNVLAPEGNIGRGGPAAAPSVGLLRRAPARIGTFWSAGNAAALVSEIDSVGRTDYRVSHSSTAGDFRRPLDAAAINYIDLSAAGWRPLGARGAAIGRAALRRTDFEGSNFALGLAPYSSSPLIPTDTTTPGMYRNVVVLEGGLAWQLSRWEVGGAVGLEVTDARAERARIGRTGRMSSPSLAIGVTRHVYGPLRLGLHGRAGMRNEVLQTLPINSVEYVLQLEGLFEIEPRELGLREGRYRRLFEREHRALGISARADFLGVTAIAFAERGGEKEAQSTAEARDPPRDRWETNTRTFGGAAHSALFGNLITINAETRYTRQIGDATRSDLQGRIYRSVDHRLQTLGEVRLQPRGSRWSVAGLGFMRRDRRNHRDALAELDTEMITWLGGGTIEADHAFFANGRIAAGYGLSIYTPAGLIPAGETLGPIFRRLIAPELEWATTQTRTHRTSLTVTIPIGARTRMWLGGERLVTVPFATPKPFPFRPGGVRTTTALSLGITVH